MTYGEFLRACRLLAKVETKSEFSRLLGLKDPDHYIGAENDTLGKRPSLDLLEAAAKLAGIDFQQCLQLPEKHRGTMTKEQEAIHRKLQDILGLKNEAPLWITGNIETFHKAYVRKRR